ncbi:hypothetical protein ANN_15858 [Periplaneta americana]|uniref:Reverse transcriptase domain-containing protein n=1 Tax=Periplaneta americana TaxID=6978 RepID=A0ABQ8SI37_PERAM|nr:hypothetical protein ANN_15858 [Periplaneta americana]
MAGLSEGGNGPAGSIKALSSFLILSISHAPSYIDMDSFKYLGCTISSNMSCCQEVKRRLAMAKEAFNRNRRIFCGPLEKELKNRLLKCFVSNIALYGTETWTLRRSDEKRLEAFEMWIWRRIERVKWTNRSCVGKSGINTRHQYKNLISTETSSSPSIPPHHHKNLVIRINISLPASKPRHQYQHFITIINTSSSASTPRHQH